MQKSNVKKILAVLAILSTLTTASAVYADDTVSTIRGGDNNILYPANIVIESTENYCQMLTTGILTYNGKTFVQNGYTAELIMELQSSENNWDAVATWQDSDIDSVSIKKTYTMKKGVSYRLKTIHKAYNSSGALLETITRYSTQVSY